jgi:hypothetical protein
MVSSVALSGQLAILRRSAQINAGIVAELWLEPG